MILSSCISKKTTEQHSTIWKRIIKCSINIIHTPTITSSLAKSCLSTVLPIMLIGSGVERKPLFGEDATINEVTLLIQSIYL